MQVWAIFTDPESLPANKKVHRKNSMTISDLNSMTQTKEKKEFKGLFKPKLPNSTKDQILSYIEVLPSLLKILIKGFFLFFDVKLPN